MQVIHQVGHVACEEGLVRPHGITAQGGLTGLGDPFLDVLQDLGLGLFHSHTLGQLGQQPGCHVHVPHKVVHLLQCGVGGFNDDVNAVAQDIQIIVRHERGHLDQGVVGQGQTRHFAVDPYDSLIRNRHVL